MSQKPSSVREYLAALPADRRKALEAVRKVVRANLDPKVKEGLQYGMIGWFVPHSVYPPGYHCTPEQPLPFASLASQKSHMALYLFCLYVDGSEAARFAEEWKATGKRLDMGKSCVRFKKLEDVPLDVVGRAIARMDVATFVSRYEAGLAGTSAGRRATKRAGAKQAGKKRAAKPMATKKRASEKQARARKAIAARGATAKTRAKR